MGVEAGEVAWTPDLALSWEVISLHPGRMQIDEFQSIGKTLAARLPFPFSRVWGQSTEN